MIVNIRLGVLQQRLPGIFRLHRVAQRLDQILVGHRIGRHAARRHGRKTVIVSGKKVKDSERNQSKNNHKQNQQVSYVFGK